MVLVTPHRAGAQAGTPLTAATALAVIVAMHARRFAWARFAVIVQVTLVVVAWGIAMDGHLVVPDVRYDDAGARPQITGPLVWALGIGSLLVLPSLYLLFRVFKTRTGPS